MGVKKDFELYCDFIGIPHNYRSKAFDELKKKAGEIAERWIRNEYEWRGYRVIKRNQKIGGFDYYMKKTNPQISSDLPNEMVVEVKINTSSLTRKQKMVYLDITEKGGEYKIMRVQIPLMLADWLG